MFHHFTPFDNAAGHQEYMNIRKSGGRGYPYGMNDKNFVMNCKAERETVRKWANYPSRIQAIPMIRLKSL